MSVVDVLGASRADPRDDALVGDGEVLSYARLGDLVDGRRDTLRAKGVGIDDIVPLVAEPSVESVVDLLALWRLGAVPVPLNARSTPAERDAARRAVEDVALPPGTQVVLWTSGTSGRPRGVALSWANLEASARAASRRLDLGSTDVWVASLSPAHVGGLALLTRSLLLGGALVVPWASDAASLLRILGGEVLEPGPAASGHAPLPRHLVPTHLSVVPTQLRRLLDQSGDEGAPHRLRCVLVGGAHAPAALVDRAVSTGWPIALTYGATEMSSQIATARPAEVRASFETARSSGTVGRPLEGVEIRVGEEVRVGEEGELWCRGPTRALGYVGPDAGELADADGWYHTGDLGRVDDDGRLLITGRRIDRIVSGGVTVDAVEVEEALRAHPMVVDACVVGLPDEEWGERVAAWIVPVHGELDVEELDRHVRNRLSPAKVPRLWHVDAHLPRNANGKVDRSRVREVLSAGRG